MVLRRDPLPTDSTAVKKKIFSLLGFAELPLSRGPDGPDPLPVPKARRWMNPIHQVAVATALEARKHAGTGASCPGESIGCHVEINDPVHGWDVLTTHLSGKGKAAHRKIPPLWLLDHLPNTTASHIAIQLGIQGPVTTCPAAAHVPEQLWHVAGEELEGGALLQMLLVQVDSQTQIRACLLAPESFAGQRIALVDSWETCRRATVRKVPT